MELCPKYIDILEGYINCTGKLNRKKCWNCILKWQELKLIYEDKSPNLSRSIKSNFYMLFYKLRYYLVKIYIALLNRSAINIVASPLMKKYVTVKTKNKQILVKKITPINRSKAESDLELEEHFLKRLDDYDKLILYIIPRSEGGSKGYPFVKNLIPKLPNNYGILIVGVELEELKKFRNVINIGKIRTKELEYLYRKADLTIVPSIYTEAFGRVVIESIINDTPVIISPQCGASYIFKNKEYVIVLQLKEDLWATKIKDMIEKPRSIPQEDLRKIENMFSPKNCAEEVISLLKKLKKREEK